MDTYTVHRPDEAAVRRLLDKHPYDAVGMAVRLAWLAGLMRSEIVALRWGDVNFLNQELTLPDRSVPLSPELEGYLVRMSERMDWGSDYVLLSDRLHRPLQPQPVSHMVRKALDEEGQQEVRLIDLRHDFIIRQLEVHDWQYVSRITGVEAVTLDQHFAAYLPAGRVSTRIRAEKTPEVDEIRLWRLLREEGTSAAGLALWLTWQAGLTLEEIAALTWAQADLNEGVLRLSAEKTVELSDALVSLLAELRQEGGGPADTVIRAPRSRAAMRPDRLSRITRTALVRAGLDDSLLAELRQEGGGPADTVIRAPRSRAAMRPDRLSRITRTALVRAGLDDLSLRDLRQDYALRSGGEERILRYAQEHGFITRNALMELFQISKPTAYRRLAQLTERGRLVRVGTRYYLPAAVVPPEEQYPVIRAYLLREGGAYRQDLAQLLHVEPKQCSVILRRLVEEGKLQRDKYRYTLREA